MKLSLTDFLFLEIIIVIYVDIVTNKFSIGRMSIVSLGKEASLHIM